MRSHLIQAAMWAPTAGKKDACLEALVAQGDGDENTANRWPETCGAVMQNGADGADEQGIDRGHPDQKLSIEHGYHETSSESHFAE